MSTYAIGDIQGCYEALMRLLERIAFDPVRDKLWLVGDLVNRGPQSLEVVRFVKSLGDRAITILGNHDLHLLVVAAGHAKKHRQDTIDDILAAPDREEFLDWLRRRKMMHAGNGYAMVHAGLLPSWTIEQALALAREVEAALQRDDYGAFLRVMYGNLPDRWRDDLTGYDRLRVITNAMTRMRLCTPDGRMEFKHTSTARNLPAGFFPWSDLADRKSRGTPVICGHWAALGLLERDDVISIDTGCLWGGSLTAVRLEDRRVFQHDCAGMAGTTTIWDE